MEVRRSGDVDFLDNLTRRMLAVVVAVGGRVRTLADDRAQSALRQELASHASHRRHAVDGLPVTHHVLDHLAHSISLDSIPTDGSSTNDVTRFWGEVHSLSPLSDFVTNLETPSKITSRAYKPPATK